MSADGEIDIAVRAEGTEDAAAELADADGGGGGGGGGRGGSLASRAGRAGTIGLLLASLLGPLLNILDPMLKILQAALAPLAAVVLRLLQPVLRLLVQLLPAWMQFVSDLPGQVDSVIEWVQQLPGRIWSFVSSLPGMIWSAISGGASWLTNGASAIGTAVWNKSKATWNSIKRYIRNLPARIGAAITSRVPGLSSNTAGDAVDAAEDFASDPVGETTETVVNITGGLESFVDRVERGDIDLLGG